VQSNQRTNSNPWINLPLSRPWGDQLSQCELADRADVSVRTNQNYRDRLETLALIRIDQNGYRLALSTQTTTGRHDPVIPTVLEKN